MIDHAVRKGDFNDSIDAVYGLRGQLALFTGAYDAQAATIGRDEFGAVTGEDRLVRGLAGLSGATTTIAAGSSLAMGAGRTIAGIGQALDQIRLPSPFMQMAVPIRNSASRLVSAEARAAKMAAVRQAGQEGEIAAGVAGPKRGIVGPISGKMRFPDRVDLVARVLKEAKNVARQGRTAQLKDYAAIAKQLGVDFQLWVRKSTILSKPLKAARDAGEVLIKFFKDLGR